MTDHLVFLVDLVQDVAISRPVAAFAKREALGELALVVSAEFRRRDANGTWDTEVEEIGRDLGARIVRVERVAEIVDFLLDKHGIVFASNESYLANHRFCHHAFAASPSSFLRVTLQHGLECIGFNHNRAHDAAFGYRVGMGCDVAASWFHLDRLGSLRPDQRSKVMAVGPPIGLDAPPVGRRRPSSPARKAPHGLVCENLHSVRFQTGGLASSFIDTFDSFAREITSVGGSVELRPHPAGRYSEKNRITLPDNVLLNRGPLYKQSLDKFTFAISAPSSVLFDMVWAGVPTAVWAARSATLDIDAYEGLTIVSSEKDWIDFAESATREPVHILRKQEEYLSSLGLPDNIPDRYRDLISLAIKA